MFSQLKGAYRNILCLALLCFKLEKCLGYNILCIYPSASYSHQKPMLAVSEALARKGHNVTVITLNPTEVGLKNYRQIDASSVYKVWQKLDSNVGFSLQKRLSPYGVVKGFCDSTEHFNRALLYNPAIDEFVRELEATNATFDVVLYEPIIYTSLLGMVLQNGKPLPPTIGLLTLSIYPVADWEMGNPFAAAYVPTLNVGYTEKMSFFERIGNFMVVLYTLYMVKYESRPVQQAIMKERFGEGLPTTDEIEKNMSMLFILNDFTTGYLRPVQQNTVFVGPIHVENQPVKPLPQDLQKWMDEAENGVIYFSLGSNMKGTSFPAEKRNAFIDAFWKLEKMRILWKWEDEELPNQPNNTMIKKWLPQTSILAHPKLKLFITQTGHQSLQESINFGVPILCIPIYGDQIQNALRVQNENAGIAMDIEDTNFNCDVLKNIQLILNDDRYKRNMMRLQKLSKDKPMTSAETAVWWVEYVVRHNGAAHLRPAVLDLAWYQLYMIDIVLFFVAVFLVTIMCLYFLIRMIFCRAKKSIKLKAN